MKLMVVSISTNQIIEIIDNSDIQIIIDKGYDNTDVYDIQDFHTCAVQPIHHANPSPRHNWSY